MSDTRRIELEAAAEVRDTDSGDGRTVEIMAVPFGKRLDRYALEIAPHAEITLRDASLPMLWRHQELIGAWSTSLQRDNDGLRAVGRVSDTTLGRDVLTLLRDGASTGASIGFDVTNYEIRRDGDESTEVVTGLELWEISLTPIPAFTDAKVTALLERTDPMPEAPATQEAPDLAPLLQPVIDRVDQLEARAYAAGTPDKHWSHEYKSAYEYAINVWRGSDESRPLRQFALDTGDSGDNAGLIQAAWLRDVQRIIQRGRPGINAFGTEPLPATGLSIQWPTYSAGNHVGEQSSQRDELTSVAVDIGESSAVAVKTYGGAMRAAFQLLERSDPVYEPIWRQAIITDWQIKTDNAFVDGLTLDDGSSTVFDFDSGSETGATFRAALFAASVDVETATGLPAEFALVASDVFPVIGGYSGLPDPGYGAGSNAEGESSARNLMVEVSGIKVIHDRNLANGTIAVSNGTAASWREDGPFFVNQDQAGILARDIAVYSYAAAAQYISTGVVSLAASYA